MFRYLLLVIFAAFLMGCGSVPRVAVTESGMPEAVFYNKTPEQVAKLVALSCMKNGYTPDINDGTVICTRTSQPDMVMFLYGIGATVEITNTIMCVAEEQNTRAFVQASGLISTYNGYKQALEIGNAEFNELYKWISGLADKANGQVLAQKGEQREQLISQ